ncbi:MAG: helix-turn-helix transcriptional regulator [Oscillibacter sp.]|nr:helix-turn-helix transcriptional regulator [Oscillibacter sp.]
MKLTELMEKIHCSQGSVEDMLALKETLDRAGISLENIYQELEMSSAYVDSHRDVSTTSTPIAPHSHSFFEFIYCSSCEDVEYLLGGQRYKLQRGDVILIPPGISHCPLFPETMKRAYERIVVWVNESLINDFANRWPEIEYADRERHRQYLLRTAGSPWEDHLHEAFARGCRESELRQSGWEAALYGNTTYLLILLNRALSQQRQPVHERSGLLDELLGYVEGHYRERITLTTAARQLLVSESSITHLIRRRMGISFYQYVTKRRLSAAKKLIDEGEALSGVGERCGFCDHSAFYRAFRREYGIAPSEYKSLQNKRRA